MAICSYCGYEMMGAADKCPNCGAPWEPEQVQNTFETGAQQGGSGNSLSGGGNQNPAAHPAVPSVPHYPTGGLMAWAVITLLLSTIPGILAIINVANINKALTEEDQQKKIRMAKIWCGIGTAIGILFIIARMSAG